MGLYNETRNISNKNLKQGRKGTNKIKAIEIGK